MSDKWLVLALGGLLVTGCYDHGDGPETDAGATDGGPDSAVLRCDDDDLDDDHDGFAGCLDCDDTDPDVSPAVNEGFCCSTNLDDRIDNDCDGEVDETPPLSGCSCWQDDPDADGYLDRFDCAPEDATVNPGITEGAWCAADRFDGKDNDCDGEVDEREDTRPCDADYDGSPEEEDCDDHSGWRSPLITESCCQCPNTPGDYRAQQCDGLDNDCDGDTDESPVCDCDQPDADYDGFRAGDDCDDGNGSAYPVLYECCCQQYGSWYCDGVDNDCDGDVDEHPGACCAQWYGAE